MNRTLTVRMRSVVALACGAVAALAGCGYTELHEVPLRAAPVAPRARVDVYLSDQTPPERPVNEIALVQAMGYGSEGNMEDLVRTLSERGRALGCDALYRVHVEQGYTMAHAYGVCVKYAGEVVASAAGATRERRDGHDARDRGMHRPPHPPRARPAPPPPPAPPAPPAPSAPPPPDADDGDDDGASL